MFREDEHVFEAIKVGAHGYVLKGADSMEVKRAIHVVVEGGSVLDRAMASKKGSCPLSACGSLFAERAEHYLLVPCLVDVHLEAGALEPLRVIALPVGRADHGHRR